MTTNSKNIMTIGKNLRHQSMFTHLLVLCMMIGLESVEVWGNTPYYAKVTANNNQNSTGSGTVYVSTSNKEDSSKYDTPPQSASNNTTDGSGNVTLYLFAKAGEHSVFSGWNTDNGQTAISGSNNNPYQVSVMASSNDDNNPTSYNYYAIFKQLPYFKFTAQANTSTGGTASASWTSETVWGTTLTQTSATKDVTYTATLTDQNYYFVGWTATNGSTNPELGTNTSLTRTLTNNSPGSTTSDQVYAIFKPKYQFMAVANVTPTGGGTVKVTQGTGTNDINNTIIGSQSATISDFKFTASPASKYSFAGWCETETGAVKYPAYPYTTSITSTALYPNAPTTKTLWAKFTPFPTFYFKAKGEVSPAGAGTVSVTSETLSAQADAADATSFTTTASFTATSSDPAIYTFAGWGKTSTATTYESESSTADLTLTSNSKDQTKPVTTTYYAIFNKAKDPESISVSSSSLTLKQKESQTITAILSPSGAYSNISFTSSNTGIATVDAATGKVRGVAQGSTTITVKAMKTDKTTYITTTVSVTVTDEVAQNKVGLNFNEGTKPYQVKNNSTANTVGQIVFENFNIPEMELTVSNCLIVPGERTYSGTRLVDFVGTLQAGSKSVKLGTYQIVDCETFYFQDSNSMPNNNLWAYSFTGWHITNTNTSSSIDAIKSGKKVPSQTVFQPGDVISPEILKEYGILDSEGNVVANAQLNFEALWGKCVFASDDVSSDGTGMSYTQNITSYTSKLVPKLKEIATTSAYETVVMLTGDYGIAENAAFCNIGDNKSITYKSLQRKKASDNKTVGDIQDGKKYIMNTRGTRQTEQYGSWRIDNVIGTFRYPGHEGGNRSFKQKSGEYQEMTARMEGNIGQLIRVEPSTTSGKGYVVVMNGGEITDAEVFGSGVNSDFKGHPCYFYFGRNAIFNSNFSLATSSASGQIYGDCHVTVTGGTLLNLYGTGSAGQDVQGNRYYYIYGNGVAGDNEYNPHMGICATARTSPLQGNGYVKINGCTNLNDVYGGGYDYTGTVNNVTFDIDNSTINGSVFGGGCYGSTAGDVNLTIKNSTVKKNVYGSGMGQSAMITTTLSGNSTFFKSNLTSSEWKTAFNTAEGQRKDQGGGFPQYMYDASGTTTWDNTAMPNYSVLGFRLLTCGVWGGDPYAGKFNLRFYSYFYYLSTATVENDISITIDNSTIGEANSSDGGNVYGGGAIAKVKGNITVNLNKSTVYSSVYGGGDGITQPEKVKITEFETCTKAPDPDALAERNKTDPMDWCELEGPNPIDNPNEKYNYTWSNDLSKFSGFPADKSKGINKTEKLVYTPNMDGWGDVEGKTTVSVTGGSHVYGNVFGGGNSGKVGTDTNASSNTVQTTISNSTVDGNVFGGCSNAKMSGSTEVKILGNSVIGKNVYGGGNAGEVTGKTNVQIGE